MSYLAQVKHATSVMYMEGQEMTEELCRECGKPENPLKNIRQHSGSPLGSSA